MITIFIFQDFPDLTFFCCRIGSKIAQIPRLTAFSRCPAYSLVVCLCESSSSSWISLAISLHLRIDHQRPTRGVQGDSIIKRNEVVGKLELVRPITDRDRARSHCMEKSFEYNLEFIKKLSMYFSLQCWEGSEVSNGSLHVTNDALGLLPEVCRYLFFSASPSATKSWFRLVRPK